jgi:hypothetical protein
LSMSAPDSWIIKLISYLKISLELCCNLICVVCVCEWVSC